MTATLCIDQGGQSTRAALFVDGKLAGLGGVPVETLVHGERIEHDPAALLDSVRCAVAEALRSASLVSRDIVTAGFATQRSTLVCCRRDTGVALTPAISWQDRRGRRRLEAVAAGHEARIHQVTGLRVSPHYGVGKLLWCLRHVAGVAEAARAHRLVAAPLAAYLLHGLGVSSDWQVDPVNASRLLLLDIETLDWSPDMLGVFGLRRDFVPDVRASRCSYGALRIDGARVPVDVVIGDQPAALHFAGAPRAGTVFVNIGTGAFVQCATGSTSVSDPRLLTSVSWHERRRTDYVLEGTVNGAASAVEAARSALGLARPSAERLAALLADMGDAPLYLNGIAGLGSPDWIADFESRFIGFGTSERKLAAVYESIVFLIVRNIEAMRRRTEVERIVVTGGLARVDALSERIATLTGTPVERPDDTEATLRGLDVLLRDATAANTVSNAHRFSPAGDAVTVERYRAWTRELEAAVRAASDRRPVALPDSSG